MVQSREGKAQLKVGSAVVDEVTISQRPAPAATPRFSPDGGAYLDTNVMVTVTCATAGATIRYTLDGTEPTEASATVASGGTVQTPVPGTLKAKAWKTGTNPSATAETSFLAVPEGYGALQVSLAPANTPALGARWQVADSPWLASGFSIALPPGEHVVSFKDIGGWVTPDDVTVTVVEAESAEATGLYVEHGTLQVTIGPEGVRTAGAQWRLDDGEWRNSGITLKLEEGTYAVSFKDVSGWITPADQTAIVKNEQATQATGSYVELGSLRVTLEPAAARVAGARWRVNGGAWQPSGATVIHLIPGEHTISYKRIPGRALPHDQTVTVRSGRISEITYNYDSYSLWGMGRNSHGQLGDGTTTNRHVPVLIRANGVAMAAAGGGVSYQGHSLFVTTNGELWGMGINSRGALGDGTTTTRLSPVLIFSSGVAMASAGGQHSLFVTESGELYGIGGNDLGQLGNGTRTDRHRPLRIRSSNVHSAAAGSGHSLFRIMNPTLADGRWSQLFAMGANQSGQLGDGTTTARLSPVAVRHIYHSNHRTVHAFSAGGSHGLLSAATSSDGVLGLQSWGSNSQGQLGRSAPTSHDIWFLLPGEVTSFRNIEDVAAGESHSLFITRGTTGPDRVIRAALWGMGSNSHGQLGDGTTTSRDRPVRIRDTGLVNIAAGSGHSLFTTVEGELWAMGRNTAGQLGDGTTTNRLSPVLIRSSGVVGVAAGNSYSLFWADQAVGSLRVVIEPADAIAAGAQWKVLGDDWMESGETLDNLAVGPHTLRFSGIDGWQAPPDEIVTIEAYGAISTTGTYAAVVSTPVFDPDGGEFPGSNVTVTVTCATDGAAIRYTLDGHDPTEASDTVTSGDSIIVSLPTTLKARAFHPELVPSAVCVATYARPPEGTFRRWFGDYGIHGDPIDIFRQICPVRGVAHGFRYAFGTNLPPQRPLLRVRMVNGRTVVETPAQDDATRPYVDVRVVGTDDLLSGDWTLPIAPAADTTGKPADADWHEPAGPPPEAMFFKLETELQ